MQNGKMTDVIVEWQNNLEYVEVWADENSTEFIKSVEGVENCFHQSKSKYHVYLDPRYDREYVMKEIEATIKIGEL